MSICQPINNLESHLGNNIEYNIHVSLNASIIRNKDVVDWRCNGRENTATEQVFSMVPTIRIMGKTMRLITDATPHKCVLILEFCGFFIYIWFSSSAMPHIGIPQYSR